MTGTMTQPLWIADQVRNDVAMLWGIVFTLTLALSHQVRGGLWRLVWTCCHPALWFPAYAGMTVMRCGNDGIGALE